MQYGRRSCRRHGRISDKEAVVGHVHEVARDQRVDRLRAQQVAEAARHVQAGQQVLVTAVEAVHAFQHARADAKQHRIAFRCRQLPQVIVAVRVGGLQRRVGFNRVRAHLQADQVLGEIAHAAQPL
ncbi:hypothetical protein D3C81_1200220 [compost metagenome]